jgi:hypothetical protein
MVQAALCHVGGRAFKAPSIVTIAADDPVDWI